MGWTITGIYIYSELTRDDDRRQRVLLTIAIGRDAYSVYLSEIYNMNSVEHLKIGDQISVRCKLYVNKNGKVTPYAGELLEG